MDSRPKIRPLDRRAGQIALFMTLSLTFLFSMLGLSVDLGYSYFVKLQAQAAADSAATAAAIWANRNGYLCGGGVTCNSTYSCPTNLSSATTPLQAGCLYAQTNGFLNTGNQSVTLIANNTSVGGASPALWVRANTSQTLAHWFLFLAGSSSGPVAAQSVAAVTATPAPSCIYVLDTASTQDAMVMSGSASVTAGCGVWVNSSNAKALELSGSAHLTSTQINVHGHYATSGSAVVSPVPAVGTAVVSDPFLSVPAPTVSSTCYKTGYSLSGSNSDSISPNGVFCGGINVSGSARLTMSAGTYILNGGGFTVSGSASVTGTNVMIFLTGQHGQTNAPMQISGSGTISLSPPSAGPYQGMLFFQDRTATYTSANSLSGSATTTVAGSFYFPSTTMNLSGSMGASVMAFVVKDLNVSGSATLSQDTTGTTTGLAVRSMSLIQ